MLNKSTIIGNLGRPAEVRTAGGTKVANFTLACSRKYKDRNGQEVDKTAWIRCTAWGGWADRIAECAVGEAVFVEGEIETGSYEDKDGNKRDTFEIKALCVFPLRSRKSGGNTGGQARNNDEYNQDLDDHIPF